MDTKRQINFVRAQAEKDPSQRVSKMTDMKEVENCAGIDQVAVYTTDFPIIYIGFSCPRMSPFDNQNEEAFQSLMLKAEEAMDKLQQNPMYDKIEMIYFISNGCQIAKEVGNRMSQIYDSKPSKVI